MRCGDATVKAVITTAKGALTVQFNPCHASQGPTCGCDSCSYSRSFPTAHLRACPAFAERFSRVRGCAFTLSAGGMGPPCGWRCPVASGAVPGGTRRTLGVTRRIVDQWQFVSGHTRTYRRTLQRADQRQHQLVCHVSHAWEWRQQWRTRQHATGWADHCPRDCPALPAHVATRPRTPRLGTQRHGWQAAQRTAAHSGQCRAVVKTPHCGDSPLPTVDTPPPPGGSEIGEGKAALC